MLTCYMLSTIAVTLWFVFALMSLTFLATACSALDALDTCQNPAGVVGYCCSACPATSCEDVDTDGIMNCEVQPAYRVSECINYDTGVRSLDNVGTDDVIDRSACDAAAVRYPDLNPPIQWYSKSNPAYCAENLGIHRAMDPGTVQCEQAADRAALGSGCGPTYTAADDFSTQKWQSCADAGGCNFSNKGCSKDAEDAENILECGHIWGITLLCLLTLGSSLTGSIMGCCVVCCGNDEVGGKGDSG